MNGTDLTSQNFRAAVESMHFTELRPEIALSTVWLPQKLAPLSYAVLLEVTQSGADIVPEPSGDDTLNRLVLFHGPRSEETWSGDTRLVAYIQIDMSASLAEDPLLPQVAWQWPIEVLVENSAELLNLGDTMITTNSVRYGEIGDKPQAF